MSFAISLILGLICFTASFLLTFFDALKIINLERRSTIWIHLLLIPHIVLLTHYIFKLVPCPVIWLLTVFSLFGYTFIKLLSIPTGRQNVNSRRLYILYDGIWQLAYCLFFQVIQVTFYAVLFFGCNVRFNALFAADLMVTLFFGWIIGFSGVVRISLASTRLNKAEKALCIIFSFIPVCGFFVMLYLFITIRDEYEECLYAEAQETIIQKSDLCQTKYPIILVHGVGFRDREEFNYWGRIPKTLQENGAVIYYGNQEGWATVATNAPMLKDTILQVIKETGAPKVNIIAHSKGGLDSRYAISRLGMDEYVASLTTISTPHLGVQLADFLVKMPRPLFRLLNNRVNALFRRRGDTNPEFMKVAYDFTTKNTAEFNKMCPDAAGVYYQSYATVMKNPFSSNLTFAPYILVSLLAGRQNDGLVTAESTKWGNFRGVMQNEYLRGVSHADAIDLSRTDFRGFSILDKYVEIVSDLKKMGY